MKVSSNLKKSYSQFYQSSSSEWRELGAKAKVENIINITKGEKFCNVLEVGCGEGSILELLSKLKFSENLYGIEISESGIETVLSRNIENLRSVKLFDGYNIPYPDNYFDLVICSHVLEHVEFERSLIREIKRVSKTHVFEVPIDFSFYVDQKISHYLSYGHINIYTPGLFRFLLLSENFALLKDKCTLYNSETLNFIYKNNKVALYKHKLKNIFLKSIPYLLGIKPSSYIILTSKSDEDLKIADNTN